MVAPAQQYTRGQSYIDQLLAALSMGLGPAPTPNRIDPLGAIAGYLNEPVSQPGRGALAMSPLSGPAPLGGDLPGGLPGGLPPVGPPPSPGGLAFGGGNPRVDDIQSGYASVGGPSPLGGGGLPPVGAPPPGGGVPPVGLPSAGGGGGFPDESARAGIRAGLGPAATGQPPPGGLGGPGTTGGFGGVDLNPDVADAIYADPSSALRNAYLDAGMSPSNNPYVRMAMARLQPVVAALADFQGIINAGNVTGAAGDELKTVLPGLISGLVSGKLNGRQILDQILGMADDDEIKTFLAEMGAPRLLELQGNLSGTSARRQQASARYRGNKIADLAARQQAAAGRGEDVDEREWLKIVRGR